MNPNATLQTEIVQSLLSEAAQRKWVVKASQNKCQRFSLSCWCLHRLSGNRTIQVHTLCFSVVAFMGCHQWCLSHQSSWNSTTNYISLQLRASSSSKTVQKAKQTHQQAGQARFLPERHAGTKAQLIEPCGIPHNHLAFQRRYFFIIARDYVLHLQVEFAISCNITSKSSARQFKCTWNQSNTTGSYRIIQSHTESYRINSRTSASRSIFLQTGIRQWLLSCVFILCCCLQQTQQQSTQGHGNAQTLWILCHFVSP